MAVKKTVLVLSGEQLILDSVEDHFDKHPIFEIKSCRNTSRIANLVPAVARLAIANPAPDLVVILDAPGSTLYQRKGEHSAELLEKQRQEYLKLDRRLRRSVVIDATRNADLVRREVIRLMWRRYARRLSRRGAT